MTPARTARMPKSDAMTFGTQAFITVRVGREPNHEDILLHERIICARSEFFRRAMNGNWVESKDRLVKLPEADVKVFGVYTNMVYTNKLTSRDASSEERTTKKTLYEEYVFLSKLYVLAESLQDTLAKNDVVKAMVAVAKETPTDGSWVIPPTAAVKILYEGTSANDGARKLFVDLWKCASLSRLSEKSQRLPYEFLCDLAMVLRQMFTAVSCTARDSDGTPYLVQAIDRGADQNVGGAS